MQPLLYFLEGIATVKLDIQGSSDILPLSLRIQNGIGNRERNSEETSELHYRPQFVLFFWYANKLSNSDCHEVNNQYIVIVMKQIIIIDVLLFF